MACNLCTSYGCFLKGITWISVRCFHRLNASKSCHRCWWLPLWPPDLNRWKRPFKPRIRPEKDHTRLVGICQNWEPTWIIWSLGSQFTPSQPRQSQVSRWWPQKEQAVLREVCPHGFILSTSLRPRLMECAEMLPMPHRGQRTLLGHQLPTGGRFLATCRVSGTWKILKNMFHFNCASANCVATTLTNCFSPFRCFGELPLLQRRIHPTERWTVQEARREIVAATNRSAKVRIKGKEQFTEGAEYTDLNREQL